MKDEFVVPFQKICNEKKCVYSRIENNYECTRRKKKGDNDIHAPETKIRPRKLTKIYK